MPTSFLVVRLSSMGDIVHSLPAVSALRRRFPEARIDWLVETRHREVLLDNPDVDDLIEVDTLEWRKALHRPGTWRQVAASIRRVRSRRYDVVLDLQGTIKSSVSAFLARGARRIGFEKSQLKERPAALLYRERVRGNGGSPHVIDRHLQLLKALGIETSERAFPIVVPEEHARSAARVLGEMGLQDYVALNPGGSWATKRWSPEKFAALARRIRDELGLPSLVLWGPGEDDLARTIAEGARDAAKLAPPTSLREMIPLVTKAKLFVSGDTGPMHLASAFGVPVVGIFGPTDPARNGPFGVDDVVVFQAVPCGPCYKQRCPGFDNVCMTWIEVENVMEAVRRKLAP